MTMQNYKDGENNVPCPTCGKVVRKSSLNYCFATGQEFCKICLDELEGELVSGIFTENFGDGFDKLKKEAGEDDANN